MKEPERNVAWDEDFWVDDRMSGSAHGVNEREPDAAPFILVPDGAGDYREHQVLPRPKGRLGF
ncbi:MAG TPA: hypothetical protein VMT30_09190 [Candidatus Saccharimonadia bacterium]|nr:hypothetical protein [Candidatus Saccharimonadia bacterium]